MSRARSLIQTALFLGGMLGLLGALGFLLAGGMGLLWGLLLGVALGGLGRASPGMVLRIQGARALPPTVAPRLHRLVGTLARRARLDPVPALYYLPTGMLNALAVGSREGGAAIAVSDGLLRHLDDGELAGVLAHEMSHLRSGDLKVMTLADTVGRLTRFFAGVGQILLLINLPMMLVGEAPISWWVILLLLAAPGLSALLQLGLSRSREFEADLGAARLTGDPRGLARALVKMERQRRGLFGRLLPRVPESSLLSTHPHTEDRIRRLLELVERREGPGRMSAGPGPAHPGVPRSGGQAGDRRPGPVSGTWRRIA